MEITKQMLEVFKRSIRILKWFRLSHGRRRILAGKLKTMILRTPPDVTKMEYQVGCPWPLRVFCFPRRIGG